MWMSKTEIKMRERIIKKIEDAGAISKKTAVSVAGADLDLQERYWLPYLVGTVHDGIKMTEDSRYYRKVVVL